MFEDRVIRWIASIDAPGNPIDRYCETFQIHRQSLSDSFDRGADVLANLDSFSEYWSGDESRDEVVLFVVDGSPEGSLDLAALVDRLPPRTYMVALLRAHRRVDDDRVHVIGVPAEDDADFERRCGGHLSRFMRLQPRGSFFNPPKSTFPKGRWTLDSVDAYEPSIGDAGHVTLRHDGLTYDFLQNLRQDSDLLIVFGQSALTRKIVELPLFQRWSWADDIPGASFIAINDPNLYLDDALNAGWWFGTTQRDTAREFASLVERAARALGLGPDRVVFTGGSAGGFSSFHMASCLPGARVVADIPQIDMRAYTFQGEANRAAQVAFGAPSIHHVPEELLHRVDVTERFRHEQHIPEYLYLQNVRDHTHIQLHFQYFVDRTMAMVNEHAWARHSGSIELYSAWNVNRGGHFPLNRGDTTDRIRRFMEPRTAPGAPPRRGSGSLVR